MSEIEEKEREMVDHWMHEHPLTLVEAGRFCYGCWRPFNRGEKGYECSQKCGYERQLHEECAEAPRNIRHAMHPQHTLTQQEDVEGGLCSICQRDIFTIFYKCTGAECTYVMHIRCAQGSDVMYAAAEDDELSSSTMIHHSSHPDHQLLFLRRSCSFKCDACGTTHPKGSSYLCTRDDCQYWIHQRCASLPQNIPREEHPHSLSLSFHLPSIYLRYDYRCEVCRKRLISKHWIYHCELCSYVVHLNCAFKKSLPTTREKGIMEFPINYGAVGEDLIGAFLRRQGVDAHTLIPHQDDVDYKFHHHKLRLVSSASSFQEENEEEEEEDDDDDEEDYSCRKSELICDGCITPITAKQASSSFSCSDSSSSSSSKDNYYYMRCSISSCKYYLHLACFLLPTQLASLPILHKHDHSLVLQSGDKLKPWESSFCSVCGKSTNGLYYGCITCDNGFKVDIKCASMPATIYHAAHPHHPLNLLPTQDTSSLLAFQLCDGCNGILFSRGNNTYACDICDYIMHFQCAGLPASTTSRRWDKHHPLPLTHDATLNRPGEFYCNCCEEEMYPKRWMYHCRSCDISFHPDCFKTTTGYYRNIKFGQKYVIPRAHCHTLTYQILTTKRRCDVCGEDCQELAGFYCASCIFFICFDACAEKMIKDGNVEAVD